MHTWKFDKHQRAWKIRGDRMVSRQLVIQMGKNQTESSHYKHNSVPGWTKELNSKDKVSSFKKKIVMNSERFLMSHKKHK